MSLWDWLYPHHCMLCGHLGTLLCSDCASGLTQWENDLPWPLQTYPTLTQVYSAIEYQDAGTALIQQVKYEGYWRGTRVWAQLAYASCAHQLRQHRITALVPVPQHPNHFRKRGFHPLRQCVRHLSVLSEIPAYPLLLQREGSGVAQAKKDASQRHFTHHEFRVRPGQRLSPSERVAIVDDVCTTGTTLSGCARALHTLGVTHCIGITVARTP